MQEKTMVADTLAGINGELTRYAGMIAQSENKELKQTLKQFRTACEQSQEELYQIAREKSYYVPAEKATAEEVAHVRSLFTGCILCCSIRRCSALCFSSSASCSMAFNPAGVQAQPSPRTLAMRFVVMYSPAG